MRDQRDVRLLDGEEQALLEALDDCRNPWVTPAVTLAIETTMRRGELLNLRWEDVNFEVSVARLSDTENAEPRDVPLSSKTIETLHSLPRSMIGRVLPTRAEDLKLAFQRARKHTHLEHFNFQDLRYEAVNRLFEQSWKIMEVASVSGHKFSQSLKRYTNLKASDLAKKLR